MLNILHITSLLFIFKDVKIFMDRINNFDELIVKIEKYILCILLILLLCVVFWAVIERFVIKDGQGWSDEMARYLSIWAAMLGASIGVKQNAHIGVDAFVLILPKLIKKYSAIISIVCSIIFCAFLTYTGYDITLKLIETQQRSSGMELPMFIPYLAIPVGAALMFFHFSINFINAVNELLAAKK